MSGCRSWFEAFGGSTRTFPRKQPRRKHEQRGQATAENANPAGTFADSALTPGPGRTGLAFPVASVIFYGHLSYHKDGPRVLTRSDRKSKSLRIDQ